MFTVLYLMALLFTTLFAYTRLKPTIDEKRELVRIRTEEFQNNPDVLKKEQAQLRKLQAVRMFFAVVGISSLAVLLNTCHVSA